MNVELLKNYIEKLTKIPEGFLAHPKIEKLFQERRESIESRVDWAAAEQLAYASLLDQKVPVRISGQDSKRGTFSHRHAVLFHQTKEETYTPLDHIAEDQAPFQVYNSPLSEYAVMGFEFGYSLGNPKALVIWEGQFGDFANGAQIIIDQYLAGSETKWGIKSSLTLFLPHGHEGMGPEHTSCRIERFLELSGEDNWRVVYPSTPAQFFHLLRDQALSSDKKPLIIPTPKSMLRLSDSFSNLNDLAGGEFQKVISDSEVSKSVKRLVFCMGKFYYDLKKARENKEVALIRIEQLYPFPKAEIEACLKSYPNVQTIIWAQEEPKNQGAWSYFHEQGINFEYVGRERISIPDTGILALFHKQQEEIIKKALG
jgi:2-oxoglutarate dehydrogenase E1 component